MISGACKYKNIAVLDLTHGGAIIARKLSELGYNVHAVDVYNTEDDDTLSNLKINNISTYKKPFPVDYLDLLITPIHLDPEYPMLKQAIAKNVDIATHHWIVGKILSDDKRLEDKTIIEVTGTRAKTSTSSLLADILSRKLDVVLHSSRGVEYWKEGLPETIYDGLSITPGNILQVMDRSFSEKLNPDAYIFEVSLGGTGIADFNIITTLEQDYKIAKENRWASSAKTQMINYAKSGSKLLINTDTKGLINHSAKKFNSIFEFNDGKYPDSQGDLNLILDNNDIIIRLPNETISINTGYSYDIESYTTAIAAAVSTAYNIGVELSVIKKTLVEFSGLQGRMREQTFNNCILIDNSNSGTDVTSADKSLDYALDKKCSGKVVMVMGEESAQVCEGLSLKKTYDFVNLRSSDIDQLILVGDRLHNIKLKDAYHTSTLDEGLKVAFEIVNSSHVSDNLIISNVKCFR
ncbi:Mur ligase middle domain protein [Methanohalobium evestigatum Z-7303]|uniref:Mur ligase middle domain protein n=1 Tax=Methanohalobium evestigatum (strain ATCC BAA-1072 / DSM 3721 / NBRC 107634 / OCM 161 / Z-7303) TaxID=644295 RepID=D7E8C6_METEZ|nr:coenzyme F430 synthase [Methanohalobium evestigatum]ADI73468.1 Mur ligase middle domain protein [Methanohalobium evestigatum Z-7303]